MRIFILMILLSFLGSCSDNALQQELENTQKELERTKQEMLKLEQQVQSPAPLVHLVCFKLKPEVNPLDVKNILEQLRSIEFVKQMEVGTFKDLGDPRALSDYQLILKMAFNSPEDYQSYQQHATHLAVKSALGDYLAGPPATYDYE